MTTEQTVDETTEVVDETTEARNLVLCAQRDKDTADTAADTADLGDVVDGGRN